MEIIIIVLITIVVICFIYILIDKFLFISHTQSINNIDEYKIINDIISEINTNKPNDNINTICIENIIKLEDTINNLKSELIELESKLSNNTLKIINKDIKNDKIIKNDENNTNININLDSQLLNSINPNNIIIDPILNYDIAKINDPLVDPRGRTSVDQIPTLEIARQFNFPTQGILDKYHRVGLLIVIETQNIDLIDKNYNNKSKTRIINDDEIITNNYKGIEIISKSKKNNIESFGNLNNNYSNDILELIGKKINNNWYKYFTSISDGNKTIKIVVHNHNRRELYSGDEVFIKELNKKYRVHIDQLDMIDYNPYYF